MEYKNAIVTGAGRGIGRAVALMLAKAGVNTLVCARGIGALRETSARCEKYGVKSLSYAADISNTDEIPGLVDAALTKLGDVDVLVNCAGLCPNDGIDHITPEEWDAVMGVNLRGLFFLSQRVLAHMKKKRKGYIVNINSTVALGAKPDVAVYSASKYGLTGITAALYEDAKQYGVRVSSVYPGVTDTEMLRSQEPFCSPDLWMKPEDIAYCVSFLLNAPTRMVVKDVVPWAAKFDRI